MSVIIATEYFTAEEDKKLNCAQSVLKAFQDEFGLPDDLIKDFKAYGGGRAAFGHCGALFAADFILGMADLDQDTFNVVAHLESLAGDVTCEGIKAKEQLSCLGCVQACTAYVEEALNPSRRS